MSRGTTREAAIKANGTRERILEKFGNEGETFSGIIARFDNMAEEGVSGFSRCKVIRYFSISKITYYNWLDEYGLR